MQYVVVLAPFGGIVFDVPGGGLFSDSVDVFAGIGGIYSNVDLVMIRSLVNGADVP